MNIQVNKNSTRLRDEAGNIIGIQYPLSVDGDSVYNKDINFELSDIGTFSGDFKCVFDCYFEEIYDISNTNPKYFKFVFKRPISTSSVGIASATGDFSNAVLKFQTASGQIEYTLDDSLNNTKYKAWRYSIVPQAFDTLIIEFHTSDPVRISGILIEKDRRTVSRIQGLSLIDNKSENISTYRYALNINNPWVNRKIVNETLHRHTGVSTNPTTGFSQGDISGTIDSVVGFVIGDKVKFEEIVNGIGIQEIGVMTITNIAGNVITWDRPIANNYSIAANVDKVDVNMNVIGSLVAPIIFELHAPAGTIWQMTRIMISITSATTMDDGKFGGIPSLINGVALRAFTESGRAVVFSNWKTNSDMKLDMFDVDYSSKAPAGSYGLNGRWTFTKAEVVAELDGDSIPVQKIEALIQDDLSTLTSFEIRSQGRVFKP